MTLATQSIISLAKLDGASTVEQAQILDSVQDSLLASVLQDEAVTASLAGDIQPLLLQVQKLQLDTVTPEEKDSIREQIFSKLSTVPQIDQLLAKYVEEFKVGVLEERLAMAREEAGQDMERLAMLDQAQEAMSQGNYDLVLKVL